jgi:hypothetical protein
LISASRHHELKASDRTTVPLLRYFDIALLIVAAPILLLIGVPAVGYAAGAGAWIVLRGLGEVVEYYAARTAQPSQQVSIRLGYLLGRLFALAITVILVRRGSGKDDALAALLVIVFAFTVQLALGFANRPRSRS